MSQGTLTPTPYQTVLDASGNPVSGAKVNTYLAGTTTPVTTYTDVNLSVANANPIVADSAGRYVAYLTPGASYKFVITDSLGNAIRTQDNIPATPASTVSLDVTGVAGETLAAGQAVYLSDGSGGKTPGSWYLASAANPYSSTIPEVGIVPANIASGASGTIRLAGQMTGLAALVVGTTYFIAATPGALTATAPTNRRVLGVADTTSSMILIGNPSIGPVDNWLVNGRLTLTTGVPVTVADVLAATTLYFTPYGGNRLSLYDGTNWIVRAFSELSIAVPATTSQLYDVFVFDNAGVTTLEVLAWTNDTTRATALTTQDGVLVKTGAVTRRYLGSFRTTTVSGQTEDSAKKRYVWNYANRVRRVCQNATETADSWNYSTATLRQANANTANQLDVVVGVAEVLLEATVIAAFFNNTSGGQCSVAIGEDSTSAAAAGCLMGSAGSAGAAVAGAVAMVAAQLRKCPAVGRHFYAWLEQSVGIGTTTWNGDGGSPTLYQAGITGSIDG